MSSTTTYLQPGSGELFVSPGQFVHRLGRASHRRRDHLVVHAALEQSRDLRDHVVAVLRLRASAAIDEVRHRLQVVGVDARRIAAQVVQFHPFGNRPPVLLEHEYVRLHLPLSHRAHDAPVAIRRGRELPHPTAARFVNDVIHGRLAPPMPHQVATRTPVVIGRCQQRPAPASARNEGTQRDSPYGASASIADGRINE